MAIHTGADHYCMVKIEEVRPHSMGERAGILPGDTLVSINGNPIRDVLDYRFYLADKQLELQLERDGMPVIAKIEKKTYDDIGLEFETPLMDRKHSCRNKCIFCFIDQLPKGMRETLYFKDDDSRLSFLHGNYITMTNLEDWEIQRIIDMHISPINVSVHTTNPTLRREMMKNKRAGETLDYLRRLTEGGCELHCQIVLCRGINDGEELTRTLRDLAALGPKMQCVAIVPAGLTAFREGLYPLEPFTPEECAAVIRQVDALSEECEATAGKRLFFCADEFYIRAGLPLPEDEYYGDYAQIEDGVGMLRSLDTEFNTFLLTLSEEERQIRRSVTIPTGEASYAQIAAMAKKLEALCPNLTCNVRCIKNNFFGGHITVTGLLTGKDLYEQLKDVSLGDELLLARNMLRSEGDRFLCDMTVEELGAKLNTKIRITECDGADLVCAVLGLEG
jgi:putative radical SAM enzyme (TIGR03279 family)